MAINAGTNVVKNGLVLHLNSSASENYTLTEVEVLVVAGGGGGGHQVGGGGGAGGLLYESSHTVTPGTAISVTVGLGGNGATNGSTAAVNGQNSVFGTLTAIGGGRGANHQTGVSPNGVGGNGGSGGGGSGADGGPNGYGTNGLGGSGTLGQGNSGGFGRGSTAQNFAGNGWAGGGGGGAGRSGAPSTANGRGGNGGDGLLFNISGFPVWYAGGGGGCEESGAPASQRSRGGLGGGGQGKGNDAVTVALDGKANTGGGGGGVRDPATSAGNGGSGIVIVRYPGTQKATGGTITSVNGYTIHTFTTSGTFTPQSSQTLYGITDLGPNRRNFQIIGSPTYSATSPENFTFNGNGQAWTLTNLTAAAPELTSENFLGKDNTKEIWFNLSTLSATGEDATESSQGLLVWPGYHSGVVHVPTGFTFYLWNEGLTFAYNHSFNITLTTNTWYQVVHTMSYGQSVGRWYVNGSLQNTTSSLPTSFVRSSTLENRLNVGLARPVSTPNSFRWRLNNGKISSVRLYDRALSATEIQQNFNESRGRFGV